MCRGDTARDTPNKSGGECGVTRTDWIQSPWGFKTRAGWIPWPEYKNQKQLKPEA